MTTKEKLTTHLEFADLAGARTILLTTFRRDGTPVATPVHIAIRDGRAFFRTYDRAGKIKRLRRNPAVEVAPCTTLGRATGPTRRFRARLLAGQEAGLARRALAKKYPLIHGILVPLAHRLHGFRTVHLELIG